MFKLFGKTYEPLNEIVISKGALLHNLEYFRALDPKKSICPILKGNAYGHGLVPVAKILDQENCPFFIVDSLYEAYELKKAKIKTKILVLGYNFARNLNRRLPFEFAASDLASLKTLINLDLPFHLELETGMNRLGLRDEERKEALSLIAKAPHLFKGLFSHLMSADEPKSFWLKKQVERFHHFYLFLKKKGFSPRWVHLANSAGSQKTKLKEENTFRIGIGLYGINPYASQDRAYKTLSALQPVMTVYSTIIASHTLQKGDTLGYGAALVAKKKMRVAVLSFGYFEGLPRLLSNKGFVKFKGEKYPIIGRINMNHSFIDVSQSEATVGDKVEIPIAELARHAGTIAYEMLSRLSPTIRRVIVS